MTIFTISIPSSFLTCISSRTNPHPPIHSSPQTIKNLHFPKSLNVLRQYPFFFFLSTSFSRIPIHRSILSFPAPPLLCYLYRCMEKPLACTPSLLKIGSRHIHPNGTSKQKQTPTKLRKRYAHHAALTASIPYICLYNLPCCPLPHPLIVIIFLYILILYRSPQPHLDFLADLYHFLFNAVLGKIRQ